MSSVVFLSFADLEHQVVCSPPARFPEPSILQQSKASWSHNVQEKQFSFLYFWKYEIVLKTRRKFTRWADAYINSPSLSHPSPSCASLKNKIKQTKKAPSPQNVHRKASASILTAWEACVRYCQQNLSHCDFLRSQPHALCLASTLTFETSCA